MSTNPQPEALRLADELEFFWGPYSGPEEPHELNAAAELRRLHAENEDFRATCDHLTRENAEQIGEIVALKEQRAELLAALRACDEAMTYMSEYDIPLTLPAQVKAAIAKATGNQK